MATESRYPTGEGTHTNLGGTFADVDDDPDSPDANWQAASSNVDIEGQYTFDTPTGEPSTGTDLQQIRIWVRKDAATAPGTGSPTVAVDVYESGTLRVNDVISSAITSDSGELLTGNWTYTGFSSADGSGVEFRVNGTAAGGGPNKRSVDIGAVEWVVDYASTLDIAPALEQQLTTTFAPTVAGTVQTSTAEVKLAGLIDPQGNTDHKVLVRAQASAGAGTLTVNLMEGATQRDTWDIDLTGSFATDTHTLSTAVADTITDYTDLRLQFFGESDVGSALTVQVSWAEMQTPAGVLTPALAQQLVSTFAPELATGGATQDITNPGLAQQLATTFAPTVAPGAVDISPALEQQLVTSFAPTVAGTVKTSTVELALASLNDPQSSANHDVLVRAQASSGAGTLTASLYEGASTLIATWDITLTGSFATDTNTLSAGEANSITDYTDLRLRFLGESDVGSALTVQVSWAEMQVPTAVITPALAQQLVATFAPELALGGVTQDIAPALAQQLATAFDPTVAPGAVDVAPALAQQLAQVFAASFTIDMLPALAQQLTQAFDPSVAVGAVDVAPDAASQPVTAFDPTVAPGAVDIAPAIVSQLTQAFDPTVATSALVVAPALEQQLVTAFTPTFGIGLATALAQQLAQAFDPTVAAGAVDIAPALKQQVVTTFGPTVTPGTVDIAPALAQQLTTTHDPTVTPGAVDIAPALVSQPVTPFDPTNISTADQDITPALAQQLVQAFDPDGVLFLWTYFDMTVAHSIGLETERVGG